MNVKDAVDTAGSGLTLVKQVDELFYVIRPYTPKIKKIQINYATKASEIKYLLTIPNDVKRRTKGLIEIPFSKGFSILDIWDMDAIEEIKVKNVDGGGKWFFNVSKFPSSEKYMITVQGRIDESFLKRIVSVKCAANPTRSGENDCYWIHAALKDVKLLKDIWDELDVDRVNIDVRISVERFFSPLIPKEIEEKMKVQRELLDAVSQGRRNLQGLQSRYRGAMLKTTISPTQLYDLFISLASSETFSNYISVDFPFTLGYVEAERRITSIMPNKVKVGVMADLNLESPVARGELVFRRVDYQKGVEASFNTVIE